MYGRVPRRSRSSSRSLVDLPEHITDAFDLVIWPASVVSELPCVHPVPTDAWNEENGVNSSALLTASLWTQQADFGVIASAALR